MIFIPSCHAETLVGVFTRWILEVQKTRKMKNPPQDELILAEIVCNAFSTPATALIYAGRVTILFNFIQTNHKALMNQKLIRVKDNLILFSQDLIEILSTMPMRADTVVSLKQFDKERKKHLLKNATCINKLSI